MSNDRPSSPKTTKGSLVRTNAIKNKDQLNERLVADVYNQHVTQLKSIELDERHIVAAILYYQDYLVDLKSMPPESLSKQDIKEKIIVEGRLKAFIHILSTKLNQETDQIKKDNIDPKKKTDLLKEANDLENELKDDASIIDQHTSIMEKIDAIVSQGKKLGSSEINEIDKLDTSNAIIDARDRLEKAAKKEEKKEGTKEASASIVELGTVALDQMTPLGGFKEMSEVAEKALGSEVPGAVFSFATVTPVVSDLIQAGLQAYEAFKTFKAKYIDKREDVILPKTNIGVTSGAGALLLGGAIIAGLGAGAVGLLGTAAAAIALPIALPVITLVTTFMTLGRNLANQKKIESKVEEAKEELPKLKMEVQIEISEAIKRSLEGPTGLLASEKNVSVKICLELVQKVNQQILDEKNPHVKEHLITRRNQLIDSANLTDLKSSVLQDKGFIAARDKCAECAHHLSNLKTSLFNIKKQNRLYSPISIITAAALVGAGILFIAFPPAVIPVIALAATVALVTGVIAVLDKKFNIIDRLLKVTGLRKDEKDELKTETSLDHHHEMSKKVATEIVKQHEKGIGVEKTNEKAQQANVDLSATTSLSPTSAVSAGISSTAAITNATTLVSASLMSSTNDSTNSSKETIQTKTTQTKLNGYDPDSPPVEKKQELLAEKSTAPQTKTGISLEKVTPTDDDTPKISRRGGGHSAP